ncbi:polysaccharide deacetylase family protein [Lysinibacillus yapensis]|uniref:polysaccharide deacetylase family protein n=1 Tax=Ureibacillus yapensis TaxID=2304605 RepID=UPI001314C0CC|nr:polysaccharide deacetylase family protein [Lysinibacillus yapensis]
MKRYKWIEVLLISVIFMLSAIVGGFMVLNGDSKFQNATALASNSNPGNGIKEVKAAEQAVIEVESDFEGIRLFKDNSIDPANPYKIIYPSTKFKPVNQKITDYIKATKQQYITKIQDSKNEMKNNLSIAVKITPYKENYYSILMTKKETVNGKNVGDAYYTLFFNRKTGELIDSKKIFNQNVEHLKKLSKYVNQKMLEQKSYKNHINIKKWNILSYPYWKNYNRFVIENDAFVLYYDQGAFTDESVGTPKLSIPMSFLNPILGSAFQTSVKSDITILQPVPKKSLGKKVALTFDDGPHHKITRQVLDLLAQYDAKATFFIVGNQVAGNESIVKAILAEGHEIGNHSWSHPNLTKLSPSNVSAQVDKTNNTIFKITGHYPTVFRPPYGEKNKTVEDSVSTPLVMWTIDTLDWKYRDSSKLLPKIQKTLKNNDVILMHDIHQSTADGLEKVLIYLQKEGYECVTVSELKGYGK